MKRCECEGRIEVAEADAPLCGLFCTKCAGWVTLNLTTKEQWAAFRELNESPIKHPGQLRYDHNRGES